MTTGFIVLLSLLLSVVAFVFAFVSGMGFWPAAVLCGVAFTFSALLLALATGGIDLVTRVERSRW